MSGGAKHACPGSQTRPRKLISASTCTEVLVRWRGEDPVTGAYWGEEWRNIMDLTGDLKEGARRMERTKYPKRAALEPVQGQRSSERLREGGGKRRKTN